MKEISYLMFILYFSYNFISGQSVNDRQLFSSLRRADYSGETTYHFQKIDKYKRVTEPIIYSDSYNDNAKMIVAFNNMVVFGIFENEKHYVIRVNENLDEDVAKIPNGFSDAIDSGELFDIVTLKPTTPTTTTTPLPTFQDRIKDIQREALPGFDPDNQSLTEYLVSISANFSKMASSTN